MYTSNIKVITKLPNLISTIGDIPEEEKVIITPYGNKYTVYNFAYHYSNPLILPFDIIVDAIVHGNISLSSNVIKSDTFTVVPETLNKVSITGDGTVLLWYRFGKLDPGSFDAIMSYALENNDYVLIDALLHTLSINEAISFVLQNPSVQETFKKGLDWQFNKLGFNELLAYLNGGKYDVRRLAFFLTIATYVFPCVFTYTSIPMFGGKPIEVYLQYLNYFQEFGQLITSEITELSEIVNVQQAEITVLFSDYSLLSSEVSACCQNPFQIISKLLTEILVITEGLSKIIPKNIITLIDHVLKMLGIFSIPTIQIAEKMGIDTKEFKHLIKYLVKSFWKESKDLTKHMDNLVNDVSSGIIGLLTSVPPILIDNVNELMNKSNYLTSEISNDLNSVLTSLLSTINSILSSISIEIDVSESENVLFEENSETSEPSTNSSSFDENTVSSTSSNSYGSLWFDYNPFKNK